MIDRFLYYVIVAPLSRMPLWYIYLITDFFFVIIYYIKPYRKKVVMTNIGKSFPEKGGAEHKKTSRRFFRFFTDLLAEATKNLAISETSLRKRLRVRNPELMKGLYERNKSVVLVAGHYNNWEFLITGVNILFPHQAFGIGTPLSNKFWDDRITRRRERFGMKVTNAGSYKQSLKEFSDGPTSVLVLGDQSPAHNASVYWTRFLNQDTAFYFGTEVLANQFDMAVVYASVHKIRRGYYELELKLITENPRQEVYGAITEGYIRLLEKDIHSAPDRWLWSHKRWKMEAPKDLASVRENHKSKFEKRFRA